MSAAFAYVKSRVGVEWLIPADTHCQFAIRNHPVLGVDVIWQGHEIPVCKTYWHFQMKHLKKITKDEAWRENLEFPWIEE